LSKELSASDDAIWRILKKEGILLHRQRSWCISTDRDFAPKAADIVGLYLDPPMKAVVLCVDEKPSIQALERKTGYIETRDGKIVRAYKSTYKRHGTLNLFAALHVATGQISTSVTEHKTRQDFLGFMDGIVAEYPHEDVHVILDNYCTHKKNEEWLAAHPLVHFHFTPTSASWLNMVEIWFGIFSRKSLKGASFESKEALKEQIEAYSNAYNENSRPFVWRKREVKGSQLKNNIVNLRN
jgi:transposase